VDSDIEKARRAYFSTGIDSVADKRRECNMQVRQVLSEIARRFCVWLLNRTERVELNEDEIDATTRDKTRLLLNYVSILIISA